MSVLAMAVKQHFLFTLHHLLLGKHLLDGLARGCGRCDGLVSSPLAPVQMGSNIWSAKETMQVQGHPLKLATMRERVKEVRPRLTS